ncbi:MAG: hypothetical protein WDM88_05035 [Galbitalea sp.]
MRRSQPKKAVANEPSAATSAPAAAEPAPRAPAPIRAATTSLLFQAPDLPPLPPLPRQNPQRQNGQGGQSQNADAQLDSAGVRRRSRRRPGEEPP